MAYTFVLDGAECPHCGVRLRGEGAVEVKPGFMDGDTWDVDPTGRVVEVLPGADDPGTDLCLDYLPAITCTACGGRVEFTATPED